MKTLVKAFVCLLLLAGFIIRTQAASLVSEGTVQAVLDPNTAVPAAGYVPTAGYILSNGIPNTGAMGGVWMPDPTNSARLSSTLVYSPSIIIEPGGTYAVNFDGGSQSNGLITFTTNLQTFGSSNLPAPAEYVGPTASNFSVEVWALAPTVSDYSTMVAWGQATTASNGFEFNYGASGGNLGGAANYGANIFNWGSGGPPAAGVYHHLVTTYDGTTAKFYCDGVLVNSSTGFAGGTSFAPAAGYPIDIGAARTTSSSTAGELGAFSGTLGATSAKARMHIGKVRISDGVLTAADVSNNYAVDLPTFQLVPSTLAHAPVHRWVFNNPAGDAQSDAIVADLGTPGGQNATVVSPYVGSSFGALATFQTTSLRQGTYLHLDGGEPTNGAYADLGPGLISVNSSYATNNHLSPSANGYSSTPGGTGQLTLEGWVHVTGQPGSWGTYFAFGATTATNQTGLAPNIVNARFTGLADYGQNGPGEPSTSAAQDGQLSGTNSGFQGANFWLFQQNGTDAALVKNDMAGNSDTFYGGYSNDITASYTNGTTISDDTTYSYAGNLHDPFSMTYYAVTWNELAHELIFYVNGHETTRNITHRNMYMIYDRNGSLGRDFYFGNPLAEFDVYEFRVYSNVLAPAEVLGDYQTGPGYLNINPLGAASNLQIVRTSSSSNWVGSTAYFKVTADYTSPSPQALGVDVTANAVTFSNSNPAVLDLTAGMMRFLSPGTATITAKYAGLTASSTITVVPMSATLTHRYSFSSDTTDNGPGPYDSVNPNNNQGYPYGNYGYVGNSGIKTSGGITGALVTNGAASTPGWIDLGENFISPTYDALTVEMWATLASATSGTMPLFSFGDERVNDSGPPAYLLYNLNGNGTPSGTSIPKRGRYAIEAYSYPNAQIIWSDSDPMSQVSYGVTQGGNTVQGKTNVQIVAEYNPTGGFAAVYVNGIATSATNTYLPLLTSLVDNYNYIGASVNSGYLPAPPGSYTPNSIPGGNQTLGESVNTNNMLVEEFRTYNGILAVSNIEFDLAAGPSNFISTPGNLLSIGLTNPASLLVTQTGQAQVLGNYQFVSNVFLLAFDTNATISSDNSNILTVTPAGVMTGVSGGTAHLIASYPTKTSVTNTVAVVSLNAVLAHEWSFQTNSGVGGSNWDSIAGVMNATNMGSAFVSNGALFLITNGGGAIATNPAGDSAYEALPPFVIDQSYVVLSLECWASFTNHPGGTTPLANWCGLWSFGSVDPEPGANTTNSCYYISLTPHSGNGGGGVTAPCPRLTINPTDPAAEGGGEISAFSALTATPAASDALDGQANVQIAAIFHPFGGYMQIYTNGVLGGTNTIPSTALQSVVDSLSAIGRDTYIWDDYCDCSVSEFRIFHGLLSAQQIAMDFVTGPRSYVDLLPHYTNNGHDNGNAFVTSIYITNLNTNIYVDGYNTAYNIVYGNGSNAINETFTGLPLQGAFVTNATAGGVDSQPTITTTSTNVIKVVNNEIIGLQPGIATITANYVSANPAYNGSGSQTVTNHASATVYVSYAPGPVQLVHRYTFDEPTNTFIAHDSVGAVNAQLNWTAQFDGIGHMILDGTEQTNVTNATPGPNLFSDAETGPGLLAGLSNATFEWWGVASNNGANTYLYNRVFDTGAPVDSTADAADTNGITNCFVGLFTFNGSATSPEGVQMQHTNPGVQYGPVWVQGAAVIPTNVELQIAVVFNQTAGTGYLYTNGVLANTNVNTPNTWLSTIHDESTYFGRSHFVGSADGTGVNNGTINTPMAGVWDEFRVWNNAMSSNEVYASYQAALAAGTPDKLPSPKLTFTPNGSSFNITYPYYATRTWTLASSPSLTAPVSTWTPVATTPVTNTSGGAYVTITVPVTPGTGNQFYILK